MTETRALPSRHSRSRRELDLESVQKDHGNMG